jgi:hypothetical protein
MAGIVYHDKKDLQVVFGWPTMKFQFSQNFDLISFLANLQKKKILEILNCTFLIAETNFSLTIKN